MTLPNTFTGSQMAKKLLDGENTDVHQGVCLLKSVTFSVRHFSDLTVDVRVETQAVMCAEAGEVSLELCTMSRQL